MIINMNGAKAPETPSPVLQEKTVTPETLPTVIGADEGYDGLSQVTVNPDSQLKAENIRSGKTIFGVDGVFAGSGNKTELEEKMLTLYSGTKDAGTYRISEFNEFFAGKARRFGAICPYCYPNKIIIDMDVTDPTMSYSPWDFESSSNGLEIVFEEYQSIHYVNFKNTHIKEFVYHSAVRYTDCSFDNDIVIPEGVTSIKSGLLDYVYKNGKQNITVTIPSTVTEMVTPSFGSYSNPCILVMKPTTPPTLKQDYSNYVSKIIVPQGTLQAYQTAAKWSTYANIMEEATE